ncbi:cysteine desulfurase [Patescibacteria group bacterium]|nr:cysteine desulfurase [Patescibacteria group bacterium]
MKKREVYLDNAATTPVDAAVFKKMLPYFSEKYGNPSSVHKIGDQARQGVEKARQQVASFLNCLPDEIYFTAGATESDNWIINGIVDIFRKDNSDKPHLVTLVFEHKAILEPIRVLEKRGLIEVNFLPVSKDGLIEVKEVEKAIEKNTCLVSIMYANSEIGTVQPISQIGNLISQLNQKRKQRIVFHTDAVQAVNYLNCDVNNLNVDALSLSGHKIYGPKGIGALYLKKRTLITSLIRGGGHEKGKRSGTENVPGIVGLGEALNLVAKRKNDGTKIKKLRNKLITGILRDIPDSQLNGSLEYRLPSNANFSFKGVEGEGIIIALSEQGIYAATGSACASHSLKPSHVLTAIGLSDEQAHASVRFTLGRQTTESDINYILEVLPKVIKRLRLISGR